MNCHPIIKVLNSSPIDRTAHRVSSQRNCDDSFLIDDKADLDAIYKRIIRKRRLIESILRITTASQRENVRTRFNKGLIEKKRPRRIVEEYVQLGKNIEALAKRFVELRCEKAKTPIGREPKAIRKIVGARENQWKDAHPVWVRHNESLIAPNGDTFCRDEVLQEVKKSLLRPLPNEVEA